MERIVGKTPTEITVNAANDDILMKFSDGSECRWYHSQDCCESVYIEDICGDLDDLIGVPLNVAEVRINEESADDHTTWTFYTFRSIKGSVDIRWIGNSNGYYSESVDFFYHEVGE